MTATYEGARDSIAAINTLINDEGSGSDNAQMLRTLLLRLRDGGWTDADLRDEFDREYAPEGIDFNSARWMRDLLNAAWRGVYDSPWLRESITGWALSLSLCPLHFVDYAICFDDEDAECTLIRTIHPAHDS